MPPACGARRSPTHASLVRERARTNATSGSREARRRCTDWSACARCRFGSGRLVEPGHPVRRCDAVGDVGVGHDWLDKHGQLLLRQVGHRRPKLFPFPYVAPSGAGCSDDCVTGSLTPGHACVCGGGGGRGGGPPPRERQCDQCDGDWPAAADDVLLPDCHWRRGHARVRPDQPNALDDVCHVVHSYVQTACRISFAMRLVA
jgi:hypothetical protein